jgi:hypothetical protein
MIILGHPIHRNDVKKYLAIFGLSIFFIVVVLFLLL